MRWSSLLFICAHTCYKLENREGQFQSPRGESWLGRDRARLALLCTDQRRCSEVGHQKAQLYNRRMILCISPFHIFSPGKIECVLIYFLKRDSTDPFFLDPPDPLEAAADALAALRSANLSSTLLPPAPIPLAPDALADGQLLVAPSPPVSLPPPAACFFSRTDSRAALSFDFALYSDFPLRSNLISFSFCFVPLTAAWPPL